MFLWEASNHEAMEVEGDHIFAQALSLSPRMLQVIQIKMAGSLRLSLADCRLLVAQSPKLVRVLQASWLLPNYVFAATGHLPTLYDIHLLLDLSWDDIMAALRALRSIMAGETPGQVAGATIAILAVSLELCPTTLASLTSDFARGCLRLIQRFRGDALPRNMW